MFKQPFLTLTVTICTVLPMSGCKHLAKNSAESFLRDDEPVHVLSGHSALVSQLNFHPTEPSQVLSSSWDGSVKLWDFRQGQLLWSVDLGRAIYVSAISNARDSILVGGKDGLLVLVDMRNGSLLKTYQVGDTRSIVQATFNANDQSFVVATHTGQLILYDTETATPQLDFASHAWPNIQMVGYSQDGRRIYSADPVGLYIWNASTGALLRTLRDERRCQDDRCTPWLTTAAFLPMQNFAIAGSLNEAIYFDVESGEMFDLGVFVSEVKHVGFSADGRHGYASSLDGTILVLDMATRSLVYAYENRNPNRFGTILTDDHGYAIAPDRVTHALHVFRPDDHTDIITDRGQHGMFEARIVQISANQYHVSLFGPEEHEPFHTTPCLSVEQAADRTLVICNDGYDVQFVFLHDFSDAALAFSARDADGEALQFSMRCRQALPNNGFLVCGERL